MSAINTAAPTARAYSPSWRLASVIVLRCLVHALIRNKWGGRENVPGSGGVILAVNHLSYLDFAPDGVFLHSCGRYPVFMIKASAFEVEGIGGFLRRAGQVPVYRGSSDAALALREAAERLAEGAAVVFYPEGTTTHDRDLSVDVDCHQHSTGMPNSLELWVPKTCTTWADVPQMVTGWGWRYIGRASLGPARGGMIFGLWA